MLIGILSGMTMTTIKVHVATRDQLAQVAAVDLGGVTLESALKHLLAEQHKRNILDAYARLQADPEAWADYSAEAEEWESTAADGLAGDPWRREGEVA